MAKYLNADALITCMEENCDTWKNDDMRRGFRECARIVFDMPAADVRENLHGKWIKTIRIRKTDGADYYDPVWFCPACGQEYDAAFASHNVKYCYRCGADIGGEE